MNYDKNYMIYATGITYLYEGKKRKICYYKKTDTYYFFVGDGRSRKIDKKDETPVMIEKREYLKKQESDRKIYS